jgi:hypothetical protein
MMNFKSFVFVNLGFTAQHFDTVQNCHQNLFVCLVPNHSLISKHDRTTLLHLHSVEGQEMGAISPAPQNACKKIWGAWSITPIKKVFKIFLLIFWLKI